jgi:parallel beta-helix repeat protein
LKGNFYYVTNQISIQSNFVSGSRGAGIAFVDSERCIATNNTVIGLGYCITQLHTKNNIIRGNVCVGGRGLKKVDSIGLISDLEVNNDDLTSLVNGAGKLTGSLMVLFTFLVLNL